MTISHTIHLATALALALTLTATGCAHRPRDSAMNAPVSGPAATQRALDLAARAHEDHKAGRLDQAIEGYSQSVSLFPDFGAAWHNLALALSQRKRDTDIVAASQAYQRAIALLPTDPTPARNLGLLYFERGWGEEALTYLNQSLAIAPGDRETMRAAARVGRDLRTSSPTHLEMLKRAQLSETEPAWLTLITKERMRVENDLRERRDAGTLSETIRG